MREVKAVASALVALAALYGAAFLIRFYHDPWWSMPTFILLIVAALAGYAGTAWFVFVKPK